ncbi:putative amino acid transporter, transmembrane domain-containing protein [Helianthus annuus]|uniref:Amino acid transporter, transmembrane domain-containing protein n=1 Tax=Helianthus annuus TaxID=4232 RepID=A0A251TB61_HELAN|nr:probable amino acid permease 7 [Helianthus annuus]KAF5781334.1 putative amino acid transporter, transmembrane domain-containing protein [Helianthus annuus]KAJ0500961.1 putative amino acid transporter, transmembrane domain-containing protein [Helianthus annuus]KAJ0508620.1 putative amino acid transporter, transmembrane domain-containing protein [Helianthus annuus]KAJ0516851.1 putative amino acid transporter, transmembrane domain-containing protein [Helianthus annuus]KAJ0684856.1 putative ami
MALDTPLMLPAATYKQTGNIWTALAHIITAVVGSGVLSLSWSVAQLGWIAGPVSLVLFALVTYLNASLLTKFHHYSDHRNGVNVTNRSYLEAVRNILGDLNARVCALLVFFNLFKLGVVYTITSASSIRAILQSNCYHEHGHEAACEYGIEFYMLLFGIIHVIASQIPNFRSTKWLSVIAAVMSFAYSFIGSGLGLAQAIGNGKIKGSIGGVPTDKPIQKVWLVAQAIGDIAFAYPFPLIFLETQSTLKSPPSAEVTMTKASRIAVFTTTVFYLCCGGFGYAAFGNSTPGNILTGFGFYEPYILIDFANACVFLHLVGGYQVFSQTLYAIVERSCSERYPESEFIKDFHIWKIRMNPLRLCFRTSYVVLTTSLAMLFPYFNEVVAFSGSVTFWPLVVYFPVEMYIVHKKVVPWTVKWCFLRVFIILCLFVAMFVFVGSVQGIIAKRFG